MIPYIAAEKFAKSRFALIMGLVFVVCFLTEEFFRKDIRNDNDRKEFARQLAAKDSIIYKRDETIYFKDQQEKIHADLDLRAAQATATEYKQLWLNYVDLKTEAKNKNIIK